MRAMLKRVGFAGISLLMIAGGLQILFGGFLEHTSASNSIYQFNGIERLMGLVPTLIGSFFFYAIVTTSSEDD